MHNGIATQPSQEASPRQYQYNGTGGTDSSQATLTSDVHTVFSLHHGDATGNCPCVSLPELMLRRRVDGSSSPHSHILPTTKRIMKTKYGSDTRCVCCINGSLSGLTATHQTTARHYNRQHRPPPWPATAEAAAADYPTAELGSVTEFPLQHARRQNQKAPARQGEWPEQRLWRRVRALPPTLHVWTYQRIASFVHLYDGCVIIAIVTAATRLEHH